MALSISRADFITFEGQGDVERFWGVETITHEDQVVYQLRYSGGLLR